MLDEWDGSVLRRTAPWSKSLLQQLKLRRLPCRINSLQAFTTVKVRSRHDLFAQAVQIQGPAALPARLHQLEHAQALRQGTSLAPPVVWKHHLQPEEEARIMSRRVSTQPQVVHRLPAGMRPRRSEHPQHNDAHHRHEPRLQDVRQQ